MSNLKLSKKIKKMIFKFLTYRNFKYRYKEYVKSQIALPDDFNQLNTAMWVSGGEILDRASTFASKRYSQDFLTESKIETNMVRGLGIQLTNVDQKIVDLKNNGWLLCETSGIEELLSSYLNDAISYLKNQTGIDLKNVDYFKSDKKFQKEIVSLKEEWILSQDLTKLMIKDQTIYKIVAGYLGVDPVLSQTISWFSLPSDASKNSQSAQRWHHDCDYVRWIKVFLYITDVTETNGAHEFIPKSHSRSKVTSDGDSRFSEEQINEAYGEHEKLTFAGKKGVILFEDTRGLHRGKPLIEGYRLVLTLQFSIDLFGERSLGSRRWFSPDLIEYLVNRPRYLERYK